VKLLSNLSRVTNPGRTFIPQIDGLRFIAIMGVLACHGWDFIRFHHGLPDDMSPPGPVEKTMSAGHYGVQLFFAISGFILALPFAKQMISGGPARLRLKDYYLRRLTRIEPPYVIHLIFLTFLCLFVYRRLPPEAHHSLSHTPHWVRHILASLIYSSGFIYGGHPKLNIVLWSLEIEVQFYLVAPFLAKVFSISTAWKRRAIIAAGMIVMPILSDWIGGRFFGGESLAAHIQFFLAGFLLVDLYLTKALSFTASAFKWDLIPLAVFISVVCFQLSSLYADYLLPWLILIGCVAAFHGRIASWFLRRPLITTIGGMCYTIYMYHFHLLSVVIRAAKPFNTHILWLDCVIQFLIMAGLIILICSIIFAVFERPFMRKDWPVRFWSFVRRKGIAVGAPDLAPQTAEAPAER
jgi:peptidoglycan/LPS O-acetylase OafA/YrhL